MLVGVRGIPPFRKRRERMGHLLIVVGSHPESWATALLPEIGRRQMAISGLPDALGTNNFNIPAPARRLGVD